MIKRLRRKFIRIAMLAVTCVMVLLCLIVNLTNYLSVDNGLTQMLEMIYQNQGRVPVFPHDGKPKKMPPGTPFTPETPYSTRYFVLRYNDSGTLIQADLKNIAAVTQEDTGDYLALAIRHGEGFGSTSGYKYYVIHDGDDRWMAIFLDSHQEMRMVVMLLVLSVVAMFVCIALVYVIVVLLSRRAIDPVVRSTQKQKQFITDASHELKTPLTVLATSLTVLEMEVGSQKWIDKAKAQTEKLTELVQALVSLSRMDEEESPLTLRPFAISEAVREAAESFTDVAQSSGHPLALTIAPDLTYCGDEYAIRQLVSILLDNALRYASPGTPIALSLEKNRKGVLLRTQNECDALETEQLDRLFERFYRPDESRTASTGGFGIGLSLARSIAEGHHGSISAQSDDGRTISFLVELK